MGGPRTAGPYAQWMFRDSCWVLNYVQGCQDLTGLSEDLRSAEKMSKQKRTKTMVSFEVRENWFANLDSARNSTQHGLSTHTQHIWNKARSVKKALYIK